MLAIASARRISWMRQARRKFSAVPSSPRSSASLDDAEDWEDMILDEDDDDDDDDDDSPLEPYRTLLGLSARASWRMTPASPPEALAVAQRSVLDATPLTTRKKHTQPTLLRMIDSQLDLRDQRERERRRIFQNKQYTKQDEQQDNATRMLMHGPEQAVASVKHRLYPHYAMTKRVLLESSSLVPTFKPKRVLDFGTGCGSAAAAAFDVHGKSLEWFHLIDASKSMREVSEFLLKNMFGYDDKDGVSKKVDLSSPRITTSTHMSVEADSAFDLCLASFTMSELPDSSSILAAAALMYDKLHPGGMMAVVEPGTPDGFANIRMIRNMLLDCCAEGEDACQVIAPCTHNGPCPMERNYGNRKERRTASKVSKSKATGQENEEDEVHGTTRIGFCSFVQTMPGGTMRRRGEKLSYLVVQKGEQVSDGEGVDLWKTPDLPDHLRRRLLVQPDDPMHQTLQKEAESLRAQYLESDEDELGLEFLRDTSNRRSAGRILQAPNKKKGHVIIDCCVEDGIERHKVPKSLNAIAPGVFGAARKSRWGGFWIPSKATVSKD